MTDLGLKVSTQMTSGVARYYCGAEITIATEGDHIRNMHMHSAERAIRSG
jgi:hypothetical protein